MTDSAIPEELRRLGNIAYFIVYSERERSVIRAEAVDRVLDSVPDGWAKIHGRWVQVSDAPGYEVRGPLGKAARATVLVALDQRAGEGADGSD